MKFIGSNNEFLGLEEVTSANCYLLKESGESELSLLWFQEEGCTLRIDGVYHTFKEDEVLCLTEFHKIEVISVTRLRLFRFNRPFYCIIDHDSEVGCRGLLFFGASQVPVFSLDKRNSEVFSLIWSMFRHEMETKDHLQLEMLRSMLKRMLILCTRLFKQNNQTYNNENKSTYSELLREYNFLIEGHFRKIHEVAGYADLMNKSPKTLSNSFKKAGFHSPIYYINERLLLEARRLLSYTDTPVKEIAWQLGYEDIQSFSRFFRLHEGMSPTRFKKKILEPYRVEV